MLCIFKVCCQTLRNLHPDPRTKNKNYNRVLRQPSPPSHLAGGVLLGRAYRGCDGEARWVEEFESYLPMPVLGVGVAGIDVADAKGGGGDWRALGGIRDAHELH